MSKGADLDILFLLIPLSIVLVLLTGVIFWFALGSGQFDDLEGPAFRVLTDDDSAPQGVAPVPGPVDEQRRSNGPGNNGSGSSGSASSSPESAPSERKA